MLGDGEDVDVIISIVIGLLYCFISVNGIDSFNFVAEIFRHEGK